jgi:hypothetical protein
VRARAISLELLVGHVADAIDELPRDRRIAVAVDAAPPARADRLVELLVSELRLRGRAAVHVAEQDFLRPASLRFEFGREDPDLFYTDWFDLGAIAREVLDPIGPGGSGQVLPRLWDAESDRAYRAQYVELKPGGVVLLEGPFLIGAGLSFDLTVHLSVSTAALARRTADEDAWTLPAYRRYEQEQDPLETADISVRCDDPEHPALVTRD